MPELLLGLLVLALGLWCEYALRQREYLRGYRDGERAGIRKAMLFSVPAGRLFDVKVGKEARN
jgi:hypothetical protein